MALGFIGELPMTRPVRADGVSLDVYEIIEWVFFYVSVDGAKYLLRLRSEIRI